MKIKFEHFSGTNCSQKVHRTSAQSTEHFHPYPNRTRTLDEHKRTVLQWFCAETTSVFARGVPNSESKD